MFKLLNKMIISKKMKPIFQIKIIERKKKKIRNKIFTHSKPMRIWVQNAV